ARAGAAADALAVDRYIVEGQPEILVRGRLAAVVDVEPERLDPDLGLAGATELDAGSLERRSAVHPSAQGTVGDSRIVELDLPFDAVPLARLEHAGLVPLHAVAVAPLLAEVIHVVAEPGPRVVRAVAGELHPRRPARCGRLRRVAALAGVVVGARAPWELPARFRLPTPPPPPEVPEAEGSRVL